MQITGNTVCNDAIPHTKYFIDITYFEFPQDSLFTALTITTSMKQIKTELPVGIRVIKSNNCVQNQNQFITIFA